MKFIKSDPRPEIFVHCDVLAKLQQYCDKAQECTNPYQFLFVLEGKRNKDSIEIINADIPKQTVGTYSLLATREEISVCCGKNMYENGTEVLNCGLVKTENSETSKEMTVFEINHIVELSNVGDWFIVGKIQKQKKCNICLVLYYVDIKANIAFCYRSREDTLACDKFYGIIYPLLESEEYIKKKLDENLIVSKNYTYNYYGSYGAYNSGSYKSTFVEPEVDYPPSELNKNDLDISSIV